MKYIENKLGRQLILILVIIFDIVIITLGFLLPKFLTPIYEKNIYSALKSPLDIMNSNFEATAINTEVAYLYIVDGIIHTSNNFKTIVSMQTDDFLTNLTDEYGSFKYKKRTYYYYIKMDDNITKISVTNDSYFYNLQNSIMGVIIPILLIAFLLISLIIFVWSTIVVKKIKKLKNKIDNIENDNYDHSIKFRMDDEIQSLAISLEDMRLSLRSQEDYKNQMYQNISHDFKTPLTVIKSYIEAVEDGIENIDDAFKIIEEQTSVLEKKVHSLLYLNKLDYLKDKKSETKNSIEISEIINSSIKKFKYQRKDIKFSMSIDNSKFVGTFELWETIIDNILNNFMRYAENEIKITVKNNKLTLYNDGPNIDETFINDIFNPFRKGIKGEFGLGLSIVKKTLNLLNYDISIKNKKKGVSFIIKAN